MVGFEQAFSDTERAAEATRESAANVVSQARALTRAAQSGNIAGIKRGQEKLAKALTELQQEVSNATSCWPFTDEDEERYLGGGYVEELRSAITEKGLEAYERDERLFVSPFIVRILPTERAVRVGKKKVSDIRPSDLAKLMHRSQNKSSGFRPQRFLEALYLVYIDIVKDPSSGLAQGGGGHVVPLARIYKLMTALPGLTRDYDRTDFARDLYILESEGVRRTRSGVMASFPSSTGTKRRSGDLFSFVDPDGESIEYYGIRFDENGE